MREPLGCVDCVLQRCGITPACAGTTISCDGRTDKRRDHPRVCGNHFSASASVMFSMGSPPRVREPLKKQKDALEKARITPACAGTTCPSSCRQARPGDHPRVCGNHRLVAASATFCAGSPPRVREPQIKDPIKSAFLSRRLSKNIHFLRELKNQLRILQSSMRYFIRNTI